MLRCFILMLFLALMEPMQEGVEKSLYSPDPDCMYLAVFI